MTNKNKPTNEHEEYALNGIDDMFVSDWTPITRLKGDDLKNAVVRIQKIEPQQFQGNHSVVCEGERLTDGARVEFTMYHRATREFLIMCHNKRRFPIDVVVTDEATEQSIYLRSAKPSDLK